MIRLKSIYIACYAYLALPFLIFSLGWLKFPYNILIAIVLCWMMFRLIRETQKQETGFLVISRRTAILFIALTGFWVFLSGIGGWAFQNLDLHVRNAIFRDLINNPWPVLYSNAESQSLIPGAGPLMMVYYIGFWLPSALVGKLFGWGIANLFLFCWAWLGVILVLIMISAKLKISPVISTVFLIAFSGMDIIGQVGWNYRNHKPLDYQAWPPIVHLEWWSAPLQYSSFTTQLFWVYNQALPAWVFMSLFINKTNPRYLLLLCSLCFFLAPLPAVGVIPIAAVRLLIEDPTVPGSVSTQIRGVGGIPVIKSFLNRLRTLFSLENLFGGCAVAIPSALYLSSSLSAANWALFPFPITVKFYIFFIVIEVGVLWLLLLPKKFKQPTWYMVGALLLVFPFIAVGSGGDFTFRASLPALFLLMMGCAEELLHNRGTLRTLILICLVIGAVTPLYEMGRSVYRTASYYLSHPISPAGYVSDNITPEGFRTTYMPEVDHPYTLVADDLGSLSEYGNCVNACLNYFGDTASPFYRYLAREGTPIP